MNDEELQTDDIELDTTEASEEESTEDSQELGEGQDSDSAPDEKFTEAQQARFNQAIGKKVRQTRDMERRADELQRQVNDLQARVPVEQRPVVQAPPDPFAISDEEYRRNLAQRDQQVLAQANFDHQRQQQQQHQQRLLHEQAQQQTQ